MSRAKKIIILAAVVTSVIATAATPANAQQRHYCVANLSDGGTTTCYDGFRKAIAAASGGLLNDAPDSAVTAMADPGFAARVNALPEVREDAGFGMIVVSVEFEHPDRKGEVMISAATRECTSSRDDIDFGDGDLASRGWDNRISSSWTFANCWIRHFEDPFFAGARTFFQSGPSYIGDAMNDRTSSIQLS